MAEVNLGHSFGDAFRSATTGTPLGEVRARRQQTQSMELENNLVEQLMEEIANGDDVRYSQVFNRLGVLNPQRAQGIMATTLANVQGATQGLAIENRRVLGQLYNGDLGGAASTLGQMIVNKQKLGGDSSYEMEIAELLNSGQEENIYKAFQMLQGVEDLAVRTGILDPINDKEVKVRKSEILADGTVIESLEKGGVRVISPENQILTGKKASEQIKKSREWELDMERQEQELLQETAEAKERAKDKVEREKLAIDDGLTFAKMVPEMTRALVLLDDVETGNLEQYKLNAKRFFGIEQADESELANILESNIIKQIKPMFGAQVTVQEGQWLREIEESFGKNTEANVRLLQQGLELAKLRANQGIDAALSSKDERAAKVIQDWMNFNLPDYETKEITPQTQMYQEGQTATNPQTGEKLVFINGRWVKDG